MAIVLQPGTMLVCRHVDDESHASCAQFEAKNNSATCADVDTEWCEYEMDSILGTDALDVLRWVGCDTCDDDNEVGGVHVSAQSRHMLMQKLARNTDLQGLGLRQARLSTCETPLAARRRVSQVLML